MTLSRVEFLTLSPGNNGLSSFKKKKKNVLSLFLPTSGPSLVVASGSILHGTVQASHRGSFSLQKKSSIAKAQVVDPGLSCSKASGIFWD